MYNEDPNERYIDVEYLNDHLRIYKDEPDIFELAKLHGIKKGEIKTNKDYEELISYLIACGDL